MSVYIIYVIIKTTKDAHGRSFTGTGRVTSQKYGAINTIIA
jgi:hypothetical protein